jgi:hypothetical protein
MSGKENTIAVRGSGNVAIIFAAVVRKTKWRNGICNRDVDIANRLVVLVGDLKDRAPRFCWEQGRLCDRKSARQNERKKRDAKNYTLPSGPFHVSPSSNKTILTPPFYARSMKSKEKNCRASLDRGAFRIGGALEPLPALEKPKRLWHASMS